jgi:hypothetical protein
LFELADYKKELTKCRSADDKLYNLIKFDNIPNLKQSDSTETDEYKNDVHICYTNKKRMDLTRKRIA